MPMKEQETMNAVRGLILNNIDLSYNQTIESLNHDSKLASMTV
jgi:hypothetical protein